MGRIIDTPFMLNHALSWAILSFKERSQVIDQFMIPNGDNE